MVSVAGACPFCKGKPTSTRKLSNELIASQSPSSTNSGPSQPELPKPPASSPSDASQLLTSDSSRVFTDATNDSSRVGAEKIAPLAHAIEDDKTPLDKAFPTECTPSAVDGSLLALAVQCAQENSIVEFAEIDGARKKTYLAAEVCKRTLEQDRSSKALIIAPTVPIVRQHYEIAKESGLQPQCVIGSAEVDMWGQKQWHDTIADANVLVTTPQLLLDAMDAQHVDLSCFTIMIVDECQHCSGSHPFAKIFRRYYAPDDVRVLGISTKLEKTNADRAQTIHKLEKIMYSRVRDLSCCEENV